MLNIFFSKLKHVFARIVSFSNWYVLVWPMTRILPKSRVIKIRGGYKIFARNIFGPDWVVIYEMLCRDDYELKKIIINSKKPVILDVGANIGAFTILAVKLFGRARIFDFEPDKENFKILNKNIILNNFEDRVIISDLALDKESGEKTFYIHKKEYAHSLLPRDANDQAGSVKIKSTTIEEIFKKYNFDKIDLLKLDIEGLEYEIIYNLPQEYFSKIDNIVLEIHDREGFSCEELVKFLEKNGYNVIQSAGNEKVYRAARK
jgi:FkbM family methyltransferase